jgi:hypothetical protein
MVLKVNNHRYGERKLGILYCKLIFKVCIVVIYESTNIQSKEPTSNAKGGKKGFIWATVKQHPPMHHPLDDCYYFIVDEPQLS